MSFYSGIISAAFAYVSCMKWWHVRFFSEQVVANGEDLCHLSIGLCRGLSICFLEVMDFFHLLKRAPWDISG